MLTARRVAFLAFYIAVLCVPALARAEDTPPDPDLPQPFDASTLQPMLHSPPFNRVVDYTDSLLLTGVAWLEGKPMATLVDKNTKKRYVVGDSPNEQGWRLAEASLSNELHGTEIKLQVGEEVVTIRYSESQLNPPRTGKLGPTAPAPAGERTKPSGSGSSAYANVVVNPKLLSKDAQEKFKKSMTALQGKMSKMTDEARAAYTQKIFGKLQAHDQPGAPPAPSKKSKR